MVSLMPNVEAFWIASTNFSSYIPALIFNEFLNGLVRPDMVKFSMETFIKRFQPDRYELWKAGKDVGPHPCDPVVGDKTRACRRRRQQRGQHIKRALAS